MLSASADLSSSPAVGAVVRVTEWYAAVGTMRMQPGTSRSQTVRSKMYGAVMSVPSSFTPGVTARASMPAARSTFPSSDSGMEPFAP